MEQLALPKAVADKFGLARVKNAAPRHYNGFGIIDLSGISLKRGEILVRAGFPFLVKKAVPPKVKKARSPKAKKPQETAGM